MEINRIWGTRQILLKVQLKKVVASSLLGYELIVSVPDLTLNDHLNRCYNSAESPIELVTNIPLGGQQLPPWNSLVRYRGAMKSKKSAGSSTNLRRRLFEIPNSSSSSRKKLGSRSATGAYNPTELNRPSGKGKITVTGLDIVHDDALTSEGTLMNSGKLSTEGRNFVERTKARRSAPLLKSEVENPEKGFFPAYTPEQLAYKNYHTLEIFAELKKNGTRYFELPETKQRLIDVTIVEALLKHPSTKIYDDAMGQGREPIFVAFNSGKQDYSIPNHMATFDRRPEFKYSHYITNYMGQDDQVEKFMASGNTSITYDDLSGNSQTNIGPVFGATNSSISTPIDNDVNLEEL